jgi:predicted CXXCH cytochrome family protein
VPDPSSGSQVKCEACHEPHASRNTGLMRYEGSMACLECHSAPNADPTQPDIWSKLLLNDSPNSKHPLLPQDWASGAKMTCHNSHAATSQDPLVDPHNPSPSGTWTGSLDGDTKTFCFRCHDGQALPKSSETAPWAGAVLGSGGATRVVDIQAAYNMNVHGFGVASDPSIATAYLRSDMGYMVGDVLDCTVCHDAHGSSNDFALNANISSASANKTVSAMLVYRIPAGSITASSPVGYDTRFFCSSCHLFDPATHDPMAGTNTTQFGKTDCTSCHSHVGAGGAPSSGL